jgi:DNA-binding CsgD family transcriptional regulator
MSESIDVDTKLRDVLPLIESNLTLKEVAERLGISVEAAYALVVASLRSSSQARRKV